MQGNTLFFIIIAGLLALVLALFQYFYKSKKRTSVYYVLAGLRFLTIFSVLLLIINPKFDSVSYFNEKPNLIVAIDNSESISYLKQDENVRRLVSQLKSNEQLDENFNLQFFNFGKEVQKSDTLSFDDRQSNMSIAFERFEEVYANDISPILFLTDGNQTYGNDYTYISKKSEQPVFPVVLGDTTSFADVKITQLNVNRYAYLKNRFPIEVITNYEGEENVNTQLRVSSGNSTIYSKSLTFSKNKTSEIISFTLPANRVGIGTYKAELLPLENEKNIINNSKNFAVEVIDQKTNVAIVSEITHPDLGAFKKAIESNEQRKAEILNTKAYLSKVNEFQLVILYQPTNQFKSVFEEIERSKLNVFVVAGVETNWSFLNATQKNYKQQLTNQEENFQATLNQNYSPFIVEDLDFNDFPPLLSEFGETTFSIPYETIFFKTINGTQLEEPLLATFEKNDRREAILFGQDFWRWRAQSFVNQDSFDDFDNFFGKLIQYLSSNQRKTRLNVNYESFYNGNDDITITAQYFNKNYEFEPNSNLLISLKSKESGEMLELPFVLSNSNYQVDLSGMDAGDYSFTVKATGENVSTSGELRILDYNVEKQFLNANVDKLQNVANSTSGKVYFIDDTSTLISDLIDDSRFATIQKSTKKVVPLIDFKYLLAILVLCLSIEWFIRKYNGLI
ncbi:MAG: VWA domain-containing protein [Bacteroidota bacterium]